MVRVAVIQYPGSNCEEETRRALVAAGAQAELFRWNADPAALREFDGYVIPGGFSYQDRVRAGAIAAKKPVMREVMRQAEAGKPVLGICNGAQVLVETGMIPGNRWGEVQMALAPNLMEDRSGFWCDWTHLVLLSEPADCAFTLRFHRREVIPMPVAHGEGRFMTAEEGLAEELAENGQVVFAYATPDGGIARCFPQNPNGSMLSAAAIRNPQGNVMAMMPHPERVSWLYQVPDDLGDAYSRAAVDARGDPEALMGPGPGRRVFESMVAFLRGGGREGGSRAAP